AIIYDNAMSLFLFSIGICIVHEKNEIKEVFRLPLIYALIFGILFNALRIDLPNIIFKPLEMVGAITIPLALMVLGYRLSSIKITHLKIAFFASIFKILGGFLIASLVVLFLPLNHIAKSVILIQASMPSAVMSMILCQKYKKDPEIVTSVVMLSTLMSVVAVPVILAIIR
ncbi:MAG: AEC family transporter, partial [Nanoarchaeota archaeon]